MKRVVLYLAALGAVVAWLAVPSSARVRTQAPAAQAAAHPERTTWYFYRVKWGFQAEFRDLFAKNHYPVLKEEMKTGRITSCALVPTYHGAAAGWTFAVSITYKDAAAIGPQERHRPPAVSTRRFKKEEAPVQSWTRTGVPLKSWIWHAK
jgi:hypothetical protein